MDDSCGLQYAHCAQYLQEKSDDIVFAVWIILAVQLGEDFNLNYSLGGGILDSYTENTLNFT
eukprot:1316276-Amorphochlora_amoeboformis.AAC.1